MSELKKPSAVFVFSSVLYRNDLITSSELQNIWEAQFGTSTYFWNEFCPMKTYYSSEMGEVKTLDRFFLVSTKLFDRDGLVSGKKWAIEQENKFSECEKRKVNWDFGILSLENIQLATGKNFTHRVFIGENIFSDLTLLYQGDTFQTLPWSYSDYGSKEIIEFFNHQRRLLQVKLEK